MFAFLNWLTSSLFLFYSNVGLPILSNLKKTETTHYLLESFGGVVV